MSWSHFPFSKDYVIIYHTHGNFSSRTHQLKKETHICILCNEVVPNYIIFQIKLLEKDILSFPKKNIVLLRKVEKIKPTNMEAIFIDNWGKLFIFDRYKEKEIKELLEFYNINIIEITSNINYSELSEVL